MVSLVGLHGPAGSGKDTIGDYLVEKHGWTRKLSFAYNLKEMCKAVFFLTDFDVHDQEGKRKLFKTPKVFTSRNLGSVMYWMSNTHANHPLRKGSKERVRSLVGTELINPRHILQFIGTDICRELVPTYHVDIISLQVKKEPNCKFVITDVRFPNEGDLIVDDFAGLVFKINRPDTITGNINKEHLSEISMRDWGRFSGVINNEDGLEKLYSNVDKLLREVETCQGVTEIIM